MDSVLVVDDDPHVSYIMVEFLSRAGYPVVSAERVQAALMLSGPFSLVIFDRHLPDGDGWEVAALWKMRGAEILCVTGQYYEVLPGVPMVRKPFGRETFLAAILSLIGPPTP